MSTHTNAPVVVGVDGSEHSLAAADLAAESAARRGRRLCLVDAMHLPALAAPAVPGLGWTFDDVDAEAKAMVADAAGRATTQRPSLDVTTEVLVGYPAGVLSEESSTAELLVVGHVGVVALPAFLPGR